VRGLAAAVPVGFVECPSATYDVMFGRPVPEFTPDADDVAASEVTAGLLPRGVQRCIDAGLVVPDVSAEFIARWLWAAVHGAVSLPNKS
jgi:hypothetical protein